MTEGFMYSCLTYIGLHNYDRDVHPQLLDLYRYGLYSYVLYSYGLYSYAYSI